MRAVAAIDEDRLLDAKAAGDARRVHGRVAAADDRDDAAELRRHAALDVFKQRDRVDHLLAVGGGNVEMVAVVGADGDEAGVEAA